MDASETDIAMSKYVKIIYQAETWSQSCSMREVNYTKISTTFPKHIPESAGGRKKARIGVLINTQMGRFPFSALKHSSENHHK